MLHFGDFEDAIGDMTRFGLSNSIDPSIARECSVLGWSMRHSQRFYLPQSAEILSGVPIVGAYREAAMGLPYASVSLNCGQSRDGAYKRIVIASAPINGLGEKEIAISSLIKTKNGSWSPFPVGAVISFPDGEDGYHVELSIRPDASHLEDAYGLVSEDVLSVLNLCVMLSLHNVKAELVSAPDPLGNKRKKQGKKSLYSYHVLNVDGEIWDSPRNEPIGSTVRSHLRRGHIRRLDEARRVWVRPTYVHGGTPGFVDKDYNVQVCP